MCQRGRSNGPRLEQEQRYPAVRNYPVVYEAIGFEYLDAAVPDFQSELKYHRID